MPWTVAVHTSDLSNAGTSANVHLVVYGEKGKSDDIVLSNEGNFDRGSVDSFKIGIDDVGLLKKIRVGHDNKGIGPGWHLDKVIAENTSFHEFAKFSFLIKTPV